VTKVALLTIYRHLNALAKTYSYYIGIGDKPVAKGTRVYAGKKKGSFMIDGTYYNLIIIMSLKWQLSMELIKRLFIVDVQVKISLFKPGFKTIRPLIKVTDISEDLRKKKH
jgi:hypothetical protein